MVEGVGRVAGRLVLGAAAQSEIQEIGGQFGEFRVVRIVDPGQRGAVLAQPVDEGRRGEALMAGLDDVAQPPPLDLGRQELEEGRTIDDDHYGAGIPFRFGAADDPALVPLFEAYKKRTGREPKDYFAIGDGEAIVARIADYVDAGVSKFILRPAARGDDEIMAQTRRLIDEVLPLVATRWPKPQKRRAVSQAAE